MMKKVYYLSPNCFVRTVFAAMPNSDSRLL